MQETLQLDGSMGEGGGQILRSALALSIATCQSFRINRIRAKRPQPGLRPQHLASVHAAAAISSARVDGDRVGSTDLHFQPVSLKPADDYQIEIGTAGATGLVLQTIFLPLAFRETSTSLTIIGGTHAEYAPCFDFLSQAWSPAMSKLGFENKLSLEQCGFYPRGGGKVHAVVHPAHPVRTFEWMRRGRITCVTPISVVGRLPLSIAQRQLRHAVDRLCRQGMKRVIAHAVVEERPAASAGTMLGLAVEFESGVMFFYSLGARGKSAEQVADEAVAQLLAYLRAGDQPVDPHLADQLILPLAIGRITARFGTTCVTEHLRTNAAIVENFLTCAVAITGAVGSPGEIQVLSSQN